MGTKCGVKEEKVTGKEKREVGGGTKRRDGKRYMTDRKKATDRWEKTGREKKKKKN